MTTPHQTEPSANNALGTILCRMLPSCAVHSETTRAISDHPGLRPDIIITDNQRSPVVVEAEYTPARSVEREAVDRLGLPVVGDTRVIEAAIALRYPADIADASDLDGAIREARLEYAVLYENETSFPTSGWLEGGVSDLADLIRLVSVSESEVDAAADILEQGIDRAVAILNDIGKLRPAIAYNIDGARGFGVNRATRQHAAQNGAERIVLTLDSAWREAVVIRVCPYPIFDSQRIIGSGAFADGVFV